MRKAKDIMTAPVVTVTPETSVRHLARLLLEHRINGVPVVDDTGALLGIVTQADLIDQSKRLHIPTVVALLDSVIFLESPKRFERDLRKMAGTTVGEIYTRDVVTADEETTVEQIATLMADRRVNTIPILREGTLVGVVGRGDIVRSLLVDSKP